MQRLLILRHAKSSWADEYADDWERPLTNRGIRDATRIGHLLKRLSLIPDLIITSDAVRAQTTAQIVAEAAGYRGKVVQSSLLYHAPPAAVLDVLRTVPTAAHRSVMIVGHNPGLEDLVAQLTGERRHLPTAALVQIDVDIDGWRRLDASTGARVIDAWTGADL
jgi:phosphohistidine phosphatase